MSRSKAFSFSTFDRSFQYIGSPRGRVGAAQDPEPPVEIPPPGQVFTLQELLDGPDMIIDLGGLTYQALNVIIWMVHSGKTIRNGVIDILPGATIGNIKLIQDKRYGTINYPAGVLDFTFDNVLFAGHCNFNYGLQEFNESQADLAGSSANAITTITNEAGTVTLNNCRFSNIGNSGLAGSFDHLIVNNLVATRVAKHALGIREIGGSLVEINGVTATECGNFIDLHGAGGLYPVADVAVINNVVDVDNTGRNKISGNNWSVDASNWSITQTNLVNLNLYPGFDLARCPRRFHLTNYTTRNIPTKGFRTGSNPGYTPDTVIDDAYIEDSLTGMQALQAMTVTNSTFDGIHHRYLSGAPTESNNSTINPGGDAFWAGIYDDIEYLYDDFNAEHGTNLDPVYYVPAAVRALMVHP